MARTLVLANKAIKNIMDNLIGFTHFSYPQGNILLPQIKCCGARKVYFSKQ